MSGHRARKRFGQHFLTDSGVIDAIIREVAPAADETLVEIGPGQGAITASLATQAGHLHAIELDRDLAARLETRFATTDNLTLHSADALRFDYASLGDELRVVGNLPYNISTPLLFHLLTFRERISDMHFMLQKEVVDRMAAEPGSKTYGRLSIMLGCHFDIEALFDVPPEAFDPPPAVNSAVVRLQPLPPGTYPLTDAALLSKLVATAFSQRRKTLRNALRSVVTPEHLEQLDIDGDLRPEAIEIHDYVRLANSLLE